jgi:hypothetical protein
VQRRVKLEVSRSSYDRFLAGGMPEPVLIGGERVTFVQTLEVAEAIVERLLTANDPEATRDGRQGLIQILTFRSALPQPATSEIIPGDSPATATGDTRSEHASERQDENLHGERNGDRP